MVWPIRQLGRLISDLSRAGVSIDRIFEIMSSPEEKEPENALTPDMNADICFSHVSFSYDSKEVLTDVSFEMKKGTTLGILGTTGAGKSTLVMLLDKLYPLPEGSGRITVGGVDIKDISTPYLRKNIGLVLQEPFLFSQTINERSKNSSVIIISHRINTLSSADKIIVLEHGKVAAEGTHSELIKKEGLYKKIYEAQSLKGAENDEE